LCIEEAITKASMFCVLASKQSVESNYVRAEVENALNTEKTVVPICIDDCKLPLRWSMNQYLTWRVSGDDSLPLRGNETDYFTTGSESLENVVSKLSKVFPKNTKSEFVRLLELPEEEADLKALIKTYYEWVPDWEINMGRSNENKKWGRVHTDRIVLNETIDFSVVSEDSAGTKSTYVYLGPVHMPPTVSGNLISPFFNELVIRVKKQLPEIYDADGTHIIIIYGRRVDWTLEANRIRRQVEQELSQIYSNLHCTIMSYDRLIEK
jgi:hypothetical protein